MPRDRLDGIHTREGRVVYDRKPTKFTLRDVRRILNKVVAEAAIFSGGESEVTNPCVGYTQVIRDMVDELLTQALAPECEEVVRRLILDLDSLLTESMFQGFGGGQFGGAGASR